jgi:uncharacterized linocin/CFP29 family protein
MPEEFLNRSEAPLTAAEWDMIDRTVVETARNILVGRRFLNVIGPLGIGVQTAPNYIYRGVEKANISLLMKEDETPLRASRRFDLVLPVIYKDFWLFFRDIENSRQYGLPLDLSSAAAAAAFVAQGEDDLIFNGNPELGQNGLLNIPGLISAEMNDWGKMGSAFGASTNAIARLVDAGFFGPYALIVSPVNFARMARVFENTGVLEIEQIRKVMTAGVFQTPVLADDTAVVVSTGPQNFDLLIGQDMSVAYLSQQDLNHPFRVFESLVLRIHRPGSVVVLGGGAATKQAAAVEEEGATRGRRRR